MEDLYRGTQRNHSLPGGGPGKEASSGPWASWENGSPLLSRRDCSAPAVDDRSGYWLGLH